MGLWGRWSLKKVNKLLAVFALSTSLLLTGCIAFDRYEIKNATIIGTEGTGQRHRYVINVQTENGQVINLHGGRYIHDFKVGSKIDVLYRGTLEIREIQLVGSDKIR